MTEVHLRGENGAVLYFSDGAVPEGVAHRITRGDLTRVNADGTPWDDTAPGTAVEPDPGTLPPDAPPLPSVRENRGVWTDFAISQGMDRTEANNFTKAELIEELTRLRAAG